LQCCVVVVEQFLTSQLYNYEFDIALTEAVSQTRQSATSKYEAEHIQILRHQAELEAEVQKLRAKLTHDR